MVEINSIALVQRKNKIRAALAARIMVNLTSFGTALQNHGAL